MQLQILAEEWMQEYNYSRPHKSLRVKTPIEYKCPACGVFENSLLGQFEIWEGYIPFVYLTSKIDKL